ncbi:cell division transport system permease protein [Roseibium hamelinense]|uniref:Cell division transport system permease protein n=1 Tax=Roseibium hamelinense TaxID=150831 RepID=A0A562SPX9_9HYPH|nr:ABC transporter permease [Roseibium hamelinense]MTI44042.1 ABC transporter permease [Roseibium hamelinense]TWI82750.1 cell division transport system permease protein [Roseibium hamelinense]
MATRKKQGPRKAPSKSDVLPVNLPKRPKLSGSTKAKQDRKPSANSKIRPSAAIVPPQSVAGRALTLVVAIMSFLACLTVGAVSIVWDAADAWQNDLVREITVQIRPAEGVDMLREIDKAVALTQEFPGIGSVRALSDAETRELLQPWLGSGLELETLPVPRLIQITVADPASLRLSNLKQKIESEVAGASLDDHSVWTSRLSAMAGAVVAGGIAIMILVLGSMVLSVVFATQAAMAGNKDVVSVLHFVGAEDSFIAREFQRHFLMLGLKGGVSGGIAAIISFLLLDAFTRRTEGQAGSDQLSALFGSVSVSVPGYLGVIAVVFLVAVLTALTSGLAVKAHLSKVD